MARLDRDGLFIMENQIADPLRILEWQKTFVLTFYFHSCKGLKFMKKCDIVGDKHILSNAIRTCGYTGWLDRKRSVKDE